MVKPQLRELNTNTGPVALIWLRHAQGHHQGAKQAKTSWFVLSIPLLTPRHAWAMAISWATMPLRATTRIPGQAVSGDWETPTTINDTWGFKVNDHNDWKSTEEDLVRKLIDIVSKGGGNYLLNGGRPPKGDSNPSSSSWVMSTRKWLDVNGGEAICETVAKPIRASVSSRARRSRGRSHASLGGSQMVCSGSQLCRRR